ncbi:adenylosuccinate lyase [Kordia sp. YSTF-M3]|uniref:Adenylosuccinate lyase n=1 Tax=Kordia aestuariivivens TaxID=2759037 RepID=A0ABR7QE35_9FLAO|nr:adenylosuccinate lyase [Kordia aestuariivivens]MBC8756825.1 adenylosuccinate lyase [Kordia aestuariivivens]
MTFEQLYSELNYVNHSREKRKYYADIVLNNLSLLPTLLKVVFTIDDKISARAAWLFEFVARENLDAILPYLDTYLEKMHTVHLDPAVRPMAKVAEYLIEAYYHKEPNQTQEKLTKKQREKITEACFDWMISDQKVAVKAYSMRSLYLLGKEFDWIHEELLIILERDYTSQSAAFKARGRELIKRIKKAKK